MTRPEAMKVAREMYGDGDNGWSYQAIRLYLARHGVHVAWRTAKRWANPVAAEEDRLRTRARQRQAYREQNGLTTPRVLDEDGLLRRMTALRGAGLPVTQIVNVIRLDHGLVMSRHDVSVSLTDRRVPAKVLKRTVTTA